MSKIITLAIIVVVFLGGIFLVDKYRFRRITNIPQQIFEPIANTQEKGEQEEEKEKEALETAPALTTYVSQRRVVWALDFLPDGRMIFTERAGAVNLVESGGQIKEVLKVAVHATSESGLHGVAVDPSFNDNRFVYLYYTYRSDGASTRNRVSRYILDDGALTDEKIIVDGIPGASTHDGGRLKFGPDSFLYITTGDAQEPSLSQDRSSLAGKILRVTREGEPAPGNPFGTRVYSYGHRNPQGITWDNQGRMWASEHGPSARDELNVIEAGANYGWPVITGTETRDGMRSPILQSGQSTWAPAGVAYFSGSIFFAGLRGSALYEYTIASGTLTTHLKDRLGRIRDVIVGPDGFLYVATSNRDGRGLPTAEDDRILKINPLKLGDL